MQRKVLAVACANWGAVFFAGALLGPLQIYLRSASRATTLSLVNVAYGGLLVNALAWLLLPTALSGGGCRVAGGSGCPGARDGAPRHARRRLGMCSVARTSRLQQGKMAGEMISPGK